jgi:hypothetical protein
MGSGDVPQYVRPSRRLARGAASISALGDVVVTVGLGVALLVVQQNSYATCLL